MAFIVNYKILRLEIPVNYPEVMQMLECKHNLSQIKLGLRLLKIDFFFQELG